MIVFECVCICVYLYMLLKCPYITENINFFVMQIRTRACNIPQANRFYLNGDCSLRMGSC